MAGWSPMVRSTRSSSDTSTGRPRKPPPPPDLLDLKPPVSRKRPSLPRNSWIRFFGSDLIPMGNCHFGRWVRFASFAQSAHRCARSLGSFCESSNARPSPRSVGGFVLRIPRYAQAPTAGRWVRFASSLVHPACCGSSMGSFCEILVACDLSCCRNAVADRPQRPDGANFPLPKVRRHFLKSLTHRLRNSRIPGHKSLIHQEIKFLTLAAEMIVDIV
jgi:hypothetical protein